MKIIIIILIIIFIISYLFLWRNNENFITGRNIIFLTQKESCYLFSKKHINYFNKFKFKECKIRGCISKLNQYDNRVEKCQKHYCNNVLNFNMIDKRNISRCILIIDNLYTNYFPQMRKIPWNFIKVSDQLEGGMPHTIEEFIVLPENFLNYLDNTITTNNTESLYLNICCTLIHEQIHVFQRKRYDIFKELYTNYWNFFPCDLKLSNGYLKEQRINPDGIDNWCFKYKNKLLYPFVYLKKDPLHLNDVKVSMIEYQNKKINYDNIVDISNYKDYNNFFCNVSQNYHPNEISAIILSEYMMSKITNQKPLFCGALKNIQPWINKYLQ